MIMATIGPRKKAVIPIQGVHQMHMMRRYGSAAPIILLTSGHPLFVAMGILSDLWSPPL